MGSPKKGGMWQMLMAMLISGTIGWFVLLSGQTALEVVFYRCLFGGMALMALLSMQHRWVRMTIKQSLWLILGGVTLILTWLSLFTAYHYSSISLATVIYHMQPFFLLFLSALFLREPLSLQSLFWLLLAFLGVVLISGLEQISSQNSMLIGVALALFSALGYSVTTIATRQLKGIPAEQVAALQILIGLLMLLPFPHTPLAHFSTQVWGALITLGLIHTALMYTLLYTAYQRLNTLSIATLSFVYPLVTIIIDVTLLDVKLSMPQIIGMVLILFAVIANQLGWKFNKKYSYIFEPDKKTKPTWVSWR